MTAHALFARTSIAGGTLRIDSVGTFDGIISGFGIPGGIDLATIAFGSSISATFVEAGNNLSGTLTVTDGTNTANLLCSGNTAPQISISHQTVASAPW